MLRAYPQDTKEANIVRKSESLTNIVDVFVPATYCSLIFPNLCLAAATQRLTYNLKHFGYARGCWPLQGMELGYIDAVG